MLPSWLEILVSLIIIVIGIFYLLRVIYNHRIGKKIWKAYSEVAERENLDVKKSLILLSNWPNLYGKKRGKRLYVHPDRGGRKTPSKTIFAVENKIDFWSTLIISKSEDYKPEDFHKLDVQNINKYKFDIYSKREIDESQIDELFSSDVARKIDKMIDRNEEDFRAVIFEPGLAMFSTFKIDLDEDNISDNIDDFPEIVNDMEGNTSRLNEELESQRMMKISEGTKSSYIKGLVPLLLFVVTGYLLYQTIQDFSFLFLNSSIIIGAIGISKLYVFLYNEWKYQ